MTKVLAELCTRICCRATLVATLALLFLHCPARANVVTDWNKNAEKAILSSSLAGNSVPTARVYVLMHAAIFDAVNGIKPHYTPYHVDLDGPEGASTRAAAIQAAYVVLVSLFHLKDLPLMRNEQPPSPRWPKMLMMTPGTT